jgi:Fic family protein
MLKTTPQNKSDQMLKETYEIPALPLSNDLETVPILKALAEANRSLAELKGRTATIPNQSILINTLSLQEAKASSEIENIVTTQDKLFQAEMFPSAMISAATKEVALYRDALKLGHESLVENQGLILNSMIIQMFQLLKRRKDGFRTQIGTALKNETTGQIVYVPPQNHADIIQKMQDLELFINDDSISQTDPLIKMAIIHHQFESIHPFPDGNGRIGRILNVLYLTRTKLLEIPILYLSRQINITKSEYYILLQAVRDDGAWEEWIVYMLNSVAETATKTLVMVDEIRQQMAAAKQKMRGELAKIYSQDLLNTLFRHPYTKIEFVCDDLGITRQTASKYLDLLAKKGFVRKVVSGRNNYYINEALVALFQDI